MDHLAPGLDEEKKVLDILLDVLLLRGDGHVRGLQDDSVETSDEGIVHMRHLRGGRDMGSGDLWRWSVRVHVRFLVMLA